MFSLCTHIFLSYLSTRHWAMSQGFSESNPRSLTRSSAWVLEPEASAFAESNFGVIRTWIPYLHTSRPGALDNAQLCNLLDLMCRQCYYVATWIIHACSTVLPPTLLALLIWAFEKVPPSSQMRHWAVRSCFGPGFVLSTVRLDSLKL